MALTSRRKRPLDRTIAHLRDTRLIVIATEGKRTELQYFQSFKNTRVQIRIIPTEGGLSAPEYVLERLDEFRQQFSLDPSDQLWLMFDVDRWGAGKIRTICQLANQKGYRLAISNPCFEVW